ncbi:unnamed protein product [Vicia faba]|uniref:Uncharacterized protein n=1 Tax=Vicia faba TaxID=3906 RepID=A0AAV0ZV08_VICFA|nr:unnamed protein product [Vicia faba]
MFLKGVEKVEDEDENSSKISQRNLEGCTWFEKAAVGHDLECHEQHGTPLINCRLVQTIANLLFDPFIAATEALAEGIVSALTRVWAEGASEGKQNDSLAVHELLKQFPVGHILKGNAQCLFAVFALVD